MTSPSFCEQCGAPLSASVRFCEACGAPINPGDAPIASSPGPVGAAEASPHTVARRPGWVWAVLLLTALLTAAWWSQRPPPPAAAPNPVTPAAVRSAPLVVAPNAAEVPATTSPLPAERDDDEYQRAKARYDRAYRAYTVLATEGGEGDINLALAEYRAAYDALTQLRAEHPEYPQE